MRIILNDQGHKRISQIKVPERQLSGVLCFVASVLDQ